MGRGGNTTKPASDLPNQLSLKSQGVFVLVVEILPLCVGLFQTTSVNLIDARDRESARPPHASSSQDASSEGQEPSTAHVPSAPKTP